MEPFISAPKISCLKDPYKALRYKTRGVPLKLGVPEAGKRIKTDEDSKDLRRNTILNEKNVKVYTYRVKRTVDVITSQL